MLVRLDSRAFTDSPFLGTDWKKTCSEKLINGNQELYNKYSTYRKGLKSVISLAKKKFYNKKILDNSNDHKKNMGSN